MTQAPEAEAAADELVLEPPTPTPTVSLEQAASTVKVDEATAKRIDAAVNSFVESLTAMDAESPEFERKVASISRMGREEIRRSAEASSRFLDRPLASMKQGPISQGSQVSAALVALRQQIEDLDPSRHLQGKRRFMSFKSVPFGTQMNDYFRRYQSAQHQIEAIVAGLYRGQDELMRDNAALEQERVYLWAMKTRLEQYAHMSGALDEALTRKIAAIGDADPVKARALKEDALFYVRQKRQDLLTQLAVVCQGYLAMDLIRRSNLELIKGVERATTTTVSALRTAVIASLALSNQRLVLDQVTALNVTTGNIIESTSQMLRQQTLEITNQAAGSTVSIEKLQAAFNNIYATIDTIDTYKLAALENMRKTIDILSSEINRAHEYVERSRTAELAQARANGLVSELTLPATAQGA
ncbi:MAG: toxic anion resistance protein [Chloroflexi bacterium]|nr:toxic anion resistance protein [Chloroflexota bacterium]